MKRYEHKGALKMGKIVLAFFLSLTLLVLALLFIPHPGTGERMVAEQYDEKILQELTEQAVHYINDGEFDLFLDMADEILRVEIGDEYFDQLVEDVLSDSGEFAEFVDGRAIAWTDEDENECALAIITARYEHVDISYGLIFNEQYEIIHLSVTY
jgi:hypothetical protein